MYEDNTCPFCGTELYWDRENDQYWLECPEDDYRSPLVSGDVPHAAHNALMRVLRTARGLLDGVAEAEDLELAFSLLEEFRGEQE